MSIKESALNTITALTNSDFIRMVTPAGASRKATLQTIAQHIIESYTGSTLAGRQQSVKSALDELNSTLTGGGLKTITTEYTESIAYQTRAGWTFVRAGGKFTNLTYGSYVVIASLPVGARPTTALTAPCTNIGGSKTGIMVRILEGGSVALYVPGSGSGDAYVSFAVAYPS